MDVAARSSQNSCTEEAAHNKATFHSLGCIIFEFEQGESSSTSAEVGK